MKLIRFILTRLRMRSIRQIFARLVSIVMRYEMSSESFQRILYAFSEFTNHFGVRPTFPVTATVVQRHPSQFQKMEMAGAELAVHGFRHVDYTQLSKTQIQAHYKKAVQIFDENGLHATGFRFPGRPMRCAPRNSRSTGFTNACARARRSATARSTPPSAWRSRRRPGPRSPISTPRT